MAHITQGAMNTAWPMRDARKISPTIEQKIASNYRVVEMLSGDYRIQKRTGSTWDTMISIWEYATPEDAFTRMDKLIQEAVDDANLMTVKRIVERPING